MKSRSNLHLVSLLLGAAMIVAAPVVHADDKSHPQRPQPKKIVVQVGKVTKSPDQPKGNSGHGGSGHDTHK